MLQNYSVGGCTFKTLIYQLFTVQKLILKGAFKIPRQFPTNLFFLEVRLLSVLKICIKSVLIYTRTHQELVLVRSTVYTRVVLHQKQGKHWFSGSQSSKIY